MMTQRINRRSQAAPGQAGRSLARIGTKRVLCLLLLLCAVGVSIWTTYVVSGNLFDSDTSSELILGEKLAREGGILSSSWYYSTELQVIDCQIVYALLFHLTSSWFLVRFWGAVIMQMMMLGAFGFLARQARIPFNRFCIAGAALLLPFSVPYGRIVLYHNYYSFYMIIACLTVGAYLGFARRVHASREGKRWPLWAFAGGLCLVSFLAGLGGVRQLMVCTAPLLAASLLSALVGERGEQSRLRAAWPELVGALAAFACSGIGYLVNLSAFAGVYSYTDYTGQYVAWSGITKLDEIFRNLLITLGFHDQSRLFTLFGLLGVCGLLIWLIAVLLGFHTLRNTADPAARFLCVFMFMTQLVMTGVFMMLSLGEEYRMELYFLPAAFWIIPALGKADLRPDSGLPPEERKQAKTFRQRFFSGDAPLSVHGLVAIIALALLLANGCYYAAFFRDPGSYRDVTYNGLNYGDTDNVAGMRPIAEYLRENEYTMAYASYWDAAVITELTDGQVKSLPVEVGRRKHPIQYFDWLSDAKLRDPELIATKKAAVVANFDLATELGEENQYGAVEVASFGGYTVFDLPNPAALAEDLAK
ncbi:MAG: hypothetical protein IJ153_04890 [Clostridia bacterium]|nr:hypothetical protein [Clostridia bacterium]